MRAVPCVREDRVMQERAKGPMAGVSRVMRISGRLVLVAVLSAVCASWGVAHAQDASSGTTTLPPATGVTQTPPTVEKPDPRKRRLNDREKFEQQQNLKAELKGPYKKWLEEDVVWIITDTERAGVQKPGHRWRARLLYGELLAAAQSQPRLAGQRVPRRDLRAHRVCERSTTPRANRALPDRRAATSTSRGASRTTSIPTPAAASITGRWTRAEALRRPIPSRSGTIATWRGLAMT